MKKISAHEFVCEPDAVAAAEKWLNKHPRYRFRELSIVPVKHKNQKTRGRPKLDEPLTISYLISAEIESDSATIEREKQKLGRFVLATNDLELTPDTILEYYKKSGYC